MEYVNSNANSQMIKKMSVPVHNLLWSFTTHASQNSDLRRDH